jgi:hypothetical protein
MSKRTPDQVRHWFETNKVIGRQLQKYYQGFMTDELPPRLREVLKKLDENVVEHLEHVQVIRGTKD